ncbi:MAG: PDZ domain-containing protein [Phycisphaerae bacterium]|nr:PDZ domain-containing protein [Phycisphaerae bacterium]
MYGLSLLAAAIGCTALWRLLAALQPSSSTRGASLFPSLIRQWLFQSSFFVTSAFVATASAFMIYGVGCIVVNAPASAILQDSPAAAAGLRAGDVLVTIDGKAASGWDELALVLSKPGAEAIPFTVRRDNHELQLVGLQGSFLNRSSMRDQGIELPIMRHAVGLNRAFAAAEEAFREIFTLAIGAMPRQLVLLYGDDAIDTLLFVCIVIALRMPLVLALLGIGQGIVAVEGLSRIGNASESMR